MMTQTTDRYAKVLYQLEIPQEIICETSRIFQEAPELIAVFENPVIPKKQKHRVLKKIFPVEIQNFLKVVEEHKKMGMMEEILEAYKEMQETMAGGVTAKLVYVVPPTKEQCLKMEAFICRHHHVKKVKWDMSQDKQLIGGFQLYVNGCEYDYSMQGRLQKLEQKLTRR